MIKKDIDDEHMLFGLLFVLNNKLQTIGDHFYDEITCKQWFIIAGISLFADEPPTINQIAEAINSSHQNVKQMILKLEKAGFVSIATDESDRRKLRVRLTKKSLELEKKYKDKENTFMKNLYEDIDKEAMKTTLKTLKQVEINLMKMKGMV